MSKRYCIAVILGCVVVYFLLVAFCLSESTQQRPADDPTLKGKGKDGACLDYATALSSSEWIVDNEIPHLWKVPREASPMQLVFLLGNDRYAPVDMEIQDSLNHLSYF
jgi:hypothetical protein